MSRETLLAKLMPLYRNLTDLSIKLSARLVAYDNITLYRYSMAETQYKDKVKTLIETLTDVNMHLLFPGEVPNIATYVQSLNVTNVLFIEDLLPIMAIFPWKHNDNDLKVDAGDEFEVTFTDELDKDRIIRFEITEMRSEFVEQHYYREFVVTPVRLDSTRLDMKSDGVTPKDQNIEIGKTTTDLHSEYDN